LEKVLSPFAVSPCRATFPSLYNGTGEELRILSSGAIILIKIELIPAKVLKEMLIAMDESPGTKRESLKEFTLVT
jgi:hypothetical protein